MLIGQTVIYPFASTGELSLVDYFTPWFPRRGNNVVSTIQVLDTASDAGVTPSLAWALLSKDSEDTGEGSVITASSGTVSASSADTYSWFCENCQELVRYRFQITVSGTRTGAGAAFAHFRFLAPSWLTTGFQSI